MIGNTIVTLWKIGCNWLHNWVFKLQWTLATSLQLSEFLQHECYWTSHMSCNGHNSFYVEPYMYETHATYLSLCKNNYYYTSTLVYYIFFPPWPKQSSLRNHPLLQMLIGSVFASLVASHPPIPLVFLSCCKTLQSPQNFHFLL